MKTLIIALSILLIIGASIGAYQWSTASKKNTFKNQAINYQTGLSDIWNMLKAFALAKRAQPIPTQALPVHAMSKEALLAETQDVVYRLGHSTLLVKLDQKLILIDPVFSQRASPVQWIGPKRFHQPPISIEQLPHIDVVIISHDHYDHLDKAAIEQLKDKVSHFITPLNVGNHLIEWGVDANKISQLNWWQQTTQAGIEFVATPAQHFSGRGLFDKDHTLWASWVIQGAQHNLFFSGDGGYFEGFAQIGERYGPFDLTFIETGAYNTMWSDIHMLPEQSVQAHIDVKGRVMVPIHNGTFDLALHDWNEPFERVSTFAKQHNVELITPEFGLPINIAKPQTHSLWWKNTVESTQQTPTLQ